MVLRSAIPSAGTDDYCELALEGRSSTKYFAHLGKGPPENLFVELGQLTGDSHGSIAEDFLKVLQTRQQSMRRFEQNESMVEIGESFKEPTAFAAFGRWKPDEGVGVGR